MPTGWMEMGSAALLGYLLGSIPFGLLLTKLGGAGDIRDIGSGNIGATNVLRTGRKGLAALTLLLDLLKGLAAVLIARQLFPGFEVFAAVSAFFGHLYPVWLGFKGGKGVATYAGILFGLNWPLGLIYGAVWISMLLLTRISSLSGLIAAAAAPLAAVFFGSVTIVIPLVACSLIVFWKHRENIQRLMAGTEPRIGQK
ncbi:glycerol-3-phosphate 1-O-acyltransferase PlsY [Sphingorhabdus buctiana]|uniref:Glycerol-3-phosphate acyltransferase n=1 Tax=Sphingorhabdus buctiana TaxID=1508805 RepID=A0ABW4MBL6_9SPHN